MEDLKVGSTAVKRTSRFLILRQIFPLLLYYTKGKMNFGHQLEHFSLRWNNFNDNMKAGFHDLLRTEDFVDVTIAAEGKLIQAHKMVLSVCSPYFKSIFKTNPCQHPVIFLKDVTHKELSGILQFMYLGEVSIQQEELGRFLKTAEALQIKGLTGDDDDSKNESVNETQENQLHPVRNKTKLVNNYDKETCVKKMRISSVNDLDKKKHQTSPVQNQSETLISNENHNSIVCKTEAEDTELSDEESDRVSLKDETMSESFLQLAESISGVKNDVNESSNALNSSGPHSDLTGISGLSNEPFVMTESNQGLRYYPLLTKNQGLCPICGRILQHKKNLQTHISDQHSGILRSWPCQICHKVCKTWSALRVHTNRHHTKLGSTPLMVHPLN